MEFKKSFLWNFILYFHDIYYTPLSMAIIQEDQELVQLLLSNSKIDVNSFSIQINEFFI